MRTLCSTGQLLVIGLVLSTPLATPAAPVLSTPAGTGMATPSSPFASGAIDTHWTYGFRSTLGPMPSNMSNATSVVPSPRPSGWTGNTAHSQWIQPDRANPTDGFYYYQTRFDLTGQSLEDFDLTFRMTADDEIACVVLNDWVTPYTAFNSPGSPVHGRWSDWITIDNSDRPGSMPSFLQGVNTLTFVVYNNDCDDTGLQVKFLTPPPGPNAVATSEPVTFALFGVLTAAGAIGARRRRSGNG